MWSRSVGDMSTDFAAAGAPGVVRLFGILEDGIRICASSLLGSTGCPELDKSDMRPAWPVAQPHVQTAFLRLNLTYEAY